MLEQFLEITNSSDSSRSKLDYLLALKAVDAKLKISLALFCAEDSFILVDKVKYPELWDKANLCLVLVRNYIVDETDFCLVELNQAGTVAVTAACATDVDNAAVRAGYAAANSVYTVANSVNLSNACHAAASTSARAGLAAGHAAATASHAAAHAAVAKPASSAAFEAREVAGEAAYEKYYNYMANLILAKHLPDQKAVKLLYF